MFFFLVAATLTGCGGSGSASPTPSGNSPYNGPVVASSYSGTVSYQAGPGTINKAGFLLTLNPGLTSGVIQLYTNVNSEPTLTDYALYSFANAQIVEKGGNDLELQGQFLAPDNPNCNFELYVLAGGTYSAISLIGSYQDCNTHGSLLGIDAANGSAQPAVITFPNTSPYQIISN